MKKLLITSLILGFAVINSFAQKADDIIGKYHLPNKLDIQIFKYKDKYYGKIIALNGYEDDQLKDYKNPDKSKQNDLLLGKIIITNLVYNTSEKKWVNGTMYGPEKGMFFNLKVNKISSSEIEVIGSKYLFWHTLVWEKL
jgi:hypothetical protein